MCERMQSVQGKRETNKTKNQTWVIFSRAILSLQWISWQNSCVILKAFPINTGARSLWSILLPHRRCIPFILPDSSWISSQTPENLFPSFSAVLLHAIILDRATNLITHRARFSFFYVNTSSCIVLFVEYISR